MPATRFRLIAGVGACVAAAGLAVFFQPDVGRLVAVRNVDGIRVIVAHRLGGDVRSVRYRLRRLLGGAASADETPAAAGPDDTRTAPFATLPFGTLEPSFKVPHHWRPYRADATWNQRLGPHPTLDPNDAEKLAWTFNPAFNGGQSVDQFASADPYDGAGLPVWFARRTDPLVTLRCHAGYGRGGTNACPLPARVYVPERASAQNDVDHHMVIVQPDGTEVDVWEWGAGNLAYEKNPPGLQVPPWQNGQTVEVAWGGTASVVNGNGWDSGEKNGAALVSGSNLLAGYVFASEIEVGRIDHAVAVILPCNPVDNVYPAPLGGRANTHCKGAPTSGGAPVAVGARYWLDTPDDAIDAYNLPRGEKTILHALHDYGAFHVDTNAYAFEFHTLESPKAGATYGANFATPIYAANFANVDGINIAITGAGTANDDFDTYVKPHLHVLAPCVNNGFPGGQCAH